MKENEQAMIRHRFNALLNEKLSDLDRHVADFLNVKEREILNLISSEVITVDSLRKISQTHGYINQMVLINANGDILYPNQEQQLTHKETEFLQRTNKLWQNGDVVSKSHSAGDDNQGTNQNRNYGWHTWYWGNGINLLMWYRTPANVIICAELNRIRLMADLIGELPDTNPDINDNNKTLITLEDSRNSVIYQWGHYDPAENEPARAMIHLSYPFNAWKLKYFMSNEAIQTAFLGHYGLNIIGVVVCVVVSLTILGIYFYKESNRGIREAATRVNFVNQVSHELKSPLTNIRLYAELMETKLQDADEVVTGYIDIIVSESQRLSRLIGNVLALSQKQKEKLKLNKRIGRIDDVIQSVIRQFEPIFKNKDIDIEFNPNDARKIKFDSDVLEQILVNLFSNVEKYASDGKLMRIDKTIDKNMAIMTVSDDGPGIPEKQRNKVFEPFHRVGGALTDTSTGTGIGLSISRDLARLHGGDIKILPTPKGTCFEVSINTG